MYSNYRADQNFHQLDGHTELDFQGITSGFHGKHGNGNGNPAGNAYRSGYMVPSLLGHAYVQIVGTSYFSKLPYLFSSVHLEYPSVLSRFCFRVSGHRSNLQVPNHYITFRAVTAIYSDSPVQ